VTAAAIPTSALASGAVAAPRQERVSSLQGLRGAAAALVVFAHAIEHAPGTAINPIVLTGRFGVEIFFVISGFVISYVAGERQFAPWIFIQRRIWRVAPLYWALTLVVGLSALIAPALYKTTRFDLSYLIKSLLFLPAPLPGTEDYRPIFKLGWTLNYEMFFYVAVALLFWCSNQVLRAVILTLAFGALMLGSFIPDLPGAVEFYANLNLLPFVAGVWLAVMWRKRVFQELPQPVAMGLAALATVVTVFFYFTPFEETKTPAGHLLMAGSAVLISTAALAWERIFQNSRFSTWLGDISYSLYLSHMFLIGAGWAVFNKLGLEPLSVMGAVFVAALFFGSIVFAAIVYQLVEKPLGRLWKPGGRAVS
jgi:exopolysaccharide production protein ExoZ